MIITISKMFTALAVMRLVEQGKIWFIKIKLPKIVRDSAQKRN